MTCLTKLALGLGLGVVVVGIATAVETVPGMPPVIDPANLYSETTADKLSPAVAKALPRVYVPNLQSNDVTVIDPACEWTIGPARFRSKGRSTPFAGWPVRGRATTVIVDGEVRYTA